jgi:tryptophanyl-tRNA synthetase
MKRIFSGMQPTSQLHLGNYLGALRHWVDLQHEEYHNIYCVVDLHAITAGYDRDALAQSTREIAAAYMAAGVDPKSCIIFPQSSVAGHSQLMWLLSTMTQMGKLDRMTQFKDKAGKHKEKAGLGLYAYPVLMAADILLYKATHVPVGEDQKQHLELSRDIAATFNHRYEQEFFAQPEPMIMGDATRVMSLRDGTQKMSKSAESDMSRINLTDDADLIAKKIRKAKTDPHPLPAHKEEALERPEALNLITIHASLLGQPIEKSFQDFGGQEFSVFKKELIDVAVSHLAPITQRMNEFMADPAEIDRILSQGAQDASEIAAPVLKEVQDIMGFWRA